MFEEYKLEEEDLSSLKAYQVYHKDWNSKYSRYTSLGRFRNRVASVFLEEENGYIKHSALWFFHNCIAHPILGIIPSKHTVKLHEWASKKLANKSTENMVVPPVPVIKNYLAWLNHNVVAHIAIGLVPCDATFYYHDKTAKEMDIPGWA